MHLLTWDDMLEAQHVLVHIRLCLDSVLCVLWRLRVLHVHYCQIPLILDGAIVETFDSTLKRFASFLNPRLTL